MQLTFDRLAHSIQAALATGRIGQPVSARIRLVASPNIIEPAFEDLMNILQQIWPLENYRLHSTQDPTGTQTNLQFQLETGPSLSLTLISSSNNQHDLKVLLIGNHGVVRLEGEELVQWSASGDSSSSPWKKVLDKSLDNPTPIQN